MPYKGYLACVGGRDSDLIAHGYGVGDAYAAYAIAARHLAFDFGV